MTDEERLNGELLEVRLQCIKLMGEFLDLSNVKVTNLEHLEAIRQDLNILMGQFVEAWSDKRNPHIIKKETK